MSIKRTVQTVVKRILRRPVQPELPQSLVQMAALLVQSEAGRVALTEMLQRQEEFIKRTVNIFGAKK